MGKGKVVLKMWKMLRWERPQKCGLQAPELCGGRNAAAYATGERERKAQDALRTDKVFRRELQLRIVYGQEERHAGEVLLQGGVRTESLRKSEHV